MSFQSDAAMIDDGFWAKVRRTAGKVPFIRDVIAAYYCIKDDATPLWVKSVLAGALVYFICPIDAVPDMIVGLGYVDDASVLTAAIGSVGAHLKDKHYQQVDA
jgi:uncharacterized membrane protein YkvA (DUF1232 family)